MTSTDTYQLKWHSHSSHLNGSVAALLRSERFTDVVLCTMDGSQIPAHKFILSACSVYLCTLFEGQRAVTRMGGILYVVLPSEISTKALKILVEYMYKGETTVSNEVLDTVLKAGEVLKIRGLWRQTDEQSTETPAEKIISPASNNINKQPPNPTQKKPENDTQAKATKKDDKVVKTFAPLQQQNLTRPMFIGPPKLVFIKTGEGGNAQPGFRSIGPKGQTILVTSDMNKSVTAEVDKTVLEKDVEEPTPPRILRRHAAERKYGKRTRVDKSGDEARDSDTRNEKQKKSNDANKTMTTVTIKEEPDWDASSVDDEERSIADMFHAEMTVKTEPGEDVDIEEDSLIYSPLTCELCAEVFTVPAAWVRHVEGHAASDAASTRKRNFSSSDDSEESMALLRCDLCSKHFPNPAEWVRHIQSTHTEKEGAQNKTCNHCNKNFPSHASMLIHLRTHTGERPFVCGLCNKGFNVKSNLLRHLRTLHDHTVPDEDEPSTSEPVKNES